MKPVIISDGPSYPSYVGNHHKLQIEVGEDRFVTGLIGSGLLDGKAVVTLGAPVWLAFGGQAGAEPLIWYKSPTLGFYPACVAMVPAPGDPWYDDEDKAGAAANFMQLLAEGDYPDLRE